MPRLILLIFSFLICFGFTNQSFAANFAVAPFKVSGGTGYNYLQTAIPPMFGSRLFLTGVNTPIENQENLLTKNPIASKEQAEEVRQQYNADYLIYGNITILGENVSLDVSVISENTFWQTANSNKISNLFNVVQTIADEINREVFGVRTKSPAPTANRVPLSEGIIANEINADTTTYLNPELRYQGAESQRGRTRPLDYASYGFEIADFNNDGNNEVAILSDNEINLYYYNDDILELIATYRLPTTDSPLRIRKLRHNSEYHIVLATYNETTGSPSSSIFKLSNNELVEVARSRYYLSVQSVIPGGEPVLIGQNGDKTRFVRGGIFQMKFNGSTISRGREIDLPKDVNVFNFTWLPVAEKLGGDRLIMIDRNDKMVVFDDEGDRMFQTDDYFASTGVGVAVTRDITGFESVEGKMDLLFYYVPMRVVVTDLDGNGQYEAITSKPISTAMSFLNNYRTYSQSEVHAQIWDGVGMSLLWKTRRIKGTIVDVEIADPNNDGILDLVVNLNTFPGTHSMSKIRNLIVLYPLDLESVDPNSVNYSE